MLFLFKNHIPGDKKNDDKESTSTSKVLKIPTALMLCKCKTRRNIWPIISGNG